MEPTLRQLEYAVAVAEFRHFRKAAEACHVTQPALSTQIQLLEDTLGVQLFERGRRGVLITAAGEALVERAERCLAEVRELVDAARQLRAPGHGPFRFGLIPTTAPYLLPHLVPTLRTLRPGYELQLWEEQTGVLLERLRRGEIDLILLALPIEADGLVLETLAVEPFALLLPKGHPKAKMKSIQTSDLEGEAMLLLEDGHCLRDQALEVCHLAGAAEAPQIHANSLATIVQMVANGLGLTLIPASAVATETRGQRGVCQRWFDEPHPSRTLGLAWRENSARHDEYLELAAAFREQICRRIEKALH